ncbi:MAG: hypothetical protein WAV28_08035 [Sedimentisphaerales bacterium]
MSLVEGLLERNEVITFVAVLPSRWLVAAGCLVIEGRWTLGAEEGLDTCCFWGVLWLDWLLLLDFFSAKTGSKDSIRAKISIAKAILTFSWYFIVDMIRLLSTCNEITAIFETSSTYKRH